MSFLCCHMEQQKKEMRHYFLKHNDSACFLSMSSMHPCLHGPLSLPFSMHPCLHSPLSLPLFGPRASLIWVGIVAFSRLPCLVISRLPIHSSNSWLLNQIVSHSAAMAFPNLPPAYWSNFISHFSSTQTQSTHFGVSPSLWSLPWLSSPSFTSPEHGVHSVPPYA